MLPSTFPKRDSYQCPGSTLCVAQRCFTPGLALLFFLSSSFLCAAPALDEVDKGNKSGLSVHGSKSILLGDLSGDDLNGARRRVDFALNIPVTPLVALVSDGPRPGPQQRPRVR